MKKRLYLIAYAWLILAPATSWGQVEGFEESFTGQGVYQSVGTNYDGLDNVAWTMNAAGELTAEGYAFNLDGTESPITLQERISRQVYGQGSFWQEIEFKDLALGDQSGQFGAASSLSLSHLLGVGGPENRVQIGLSDPDEAGVWRLVLATVEGGEVARQEIMVPKGGEYVQLALQYNHVSSVVGGYYDPNTRDELPPIKLELPLAIDMSPESETRLTMSTSGLTNSGIVHSWRLTPILPLTGDFSGNGALDVADIDELSVQVRGATNDARFDLNANSLVDSADIAVWVHDLKKTYFGDANLDGQFDSQDLTLVFQAGHYEDAIGGNSGWASGDWDADAEFTSSDLVTAFQDGGYEKGPRPAVSAVPEPRGLVLLVMGLCGLLRLRTAR